MEKSIMEISYKLQKCQCTSKLLVIIYYIIQFLLGLPIILIKNFGQQSAQNQIFQFLMKWVILTDSVDQTILTYISVGIFIISIVHLVLFLSLRRIKEQNQIFIQIILIITVIIEAASLGILFISLNFFKKGIFYESSELIGLNMFIILYTITMKVFCTQLQINFTFKRNNIFSKMHSKSITISEGVRLISVSLLALIEQNIQALDKIILMLLILGLSLRLNSFLWNYQYPNQFMKNLTCLYVSFEASMTLLLFFNSIIQTQILIMNIGIIIPTLALFLFYGLYCFQKFNFNKITFYKVSELKSESNAIILLGTLYSFSLPSKSDDQILQLTSLLKFHSLNCKNISCYCKKDEIVPSNLSKELIANFISDKIKQIEQAFHKSIKVLSISGLFKLQAFQNYPLLSSFVKKLTQSNQNARFQQRFVLFCLNKEINCLIQQKNIKNEVIQIDLIQELQQLLNQVTNNMKKTALIKSKKNAYLSKKLCRISQLQSFCDQQLSLMSKINKSYQDKVKFFKRSKEFNTIFHFYFQFVFLLKPKLNQIKKNQILGFLKASQIIDSKSLEKSIFANEACVFTSSLSPKEIGKIMNVTKNITTFGHSKNCLINQRIENILPECIRGQHEKLLTNWLHSGRWNTIGKLKKSFLVNKDGNLCQVLMYLKIVQTINSDIRILVLVYKKNDQDYIYFNQKLEIMEIGIKIEQVLSLKRQNTPGRLIFPQITKIFKSASIQQKSIYTQAISMESLQPNLIIEYKQKVKHKRSSTILNTAFKNKLFKKQVNHFNVRINYQLIAVGKFKNLVFQITDISKKANGSVFSSQYGINDINKFDSFQDQENSNQSLSQKRKKQGKHSNHHHHDHQHNTVNSSVGSSSDNQIHALNRTISNFLQTYFNPKQISFNRLTSVTTLIIFAIIFLIIIIIGSYYLYSIGLFSISQIIFANGAVSDNMQLSQFIYNNLLVIQARNMFGSSTQQINSIIRSSLQIQNYLFNLITLDTDFLFKNVTSLGSASYYQYLKQDQTWNFPNKDRYANIDSQQFLQFFIHNSLVGLNYPEEFDSSLNRIFSNFPQMKRINHFNLKKYCSIAIHNVNTLEIVFYLSILVFAIIGTIMGVALWRFFYFKHYQKINFFENYKLINHNQFQILNKYYNGLIQYLQIANPSEKNNNQQILELQIDQTKNSSPSRLKIVNNKSFFSFIWIIFLILGLNIPNIVFNLEIRKFFQLSKQMMSSITDLMDSQNYLLEAYFDLKGYHLISNQQMDLNPFLDSLLITMKQDQILFNQILSRSIKLFSSFDDNYQSQFIDILVLDICQIVEADMSLFQAQKCKNQLKLNIRQSGIIIAMNFFQRELMSAIYQFKKGSAETKNITNYFNQVRFQEIDQSIIYMFKVYQKIQQRIFVTLNYAIINSLSLAKFFILTECFILLIFIFIWLFSINQQKKGLSQIYGYFLTIPMKILKENKHVIYHTEKILEIRN